MIFDDERDLTLLAQFASLDSLAQRANVTRDMVNARPAEVARAIHLGWLETRAYPGLLYLTRSGRERRRDAQLQINLSAMKRDKERRG